MMSSTIRTSRSSIGRVEVLHDPDHARGVRLRAVARDRHEVDLARNGELAHEVGDEEDGALQDADHEEVAALVVAADLRTELGHARRKIVLGDEGLADRRVVHSRADYALALDQLERARGDDRRRSRVGAEAEVVGDGNARDPGDAVAAGDDRDARAL